MSSHVEGNLPVIMVRRSVPQTVGGGEAFAATSRPFLESIGKSPEQLAAIEFKVTLPKYVNAPPPGVVSRRASVLRVCGEKHSKTVQGSRVEARLEEIPAE